MTERIISIKTCLGCSYHRQSGKDNNIYCIHPETWRESEDNPASVIANDFIPIMFKFICNFSDMMKEDFIPDWCPLEKLYDFLHERVY